MFFFLAKDEKKFKPLANGENIEIIDLDSDEETEESVPIEYHLVECPDKSIKTIPEYHLANSNPPPIHQMLVPGTRIIARRKSYYLPTMVDTTGRQSVFKNDDSAFYAGIVSSHNCKKNDCWYYLIFFDDGHAQYVSGRKICTVFSNFSAKYVHSNAQRFYDYYFDSVKQRAGIMEMGDFDAHATKKLRIFLNGDFELATVHRPDTNRPALVRMVVPCLSFEWEEWLYIGSPRFQQIWTTMLKNNKLDQYHDGNSTMIEVSSDSEEEDDDYVSPVKHALPPTAKDPSQKTVFLRPDLLIENLIPPQELDALHTCSNNCVQDYEMNPKIFEFDPLKRPLLAGWKRLRNKRNLRLFYVVYATPCGRQLTTIQDTYKYLLQTNSKLSIDCFTFSGKIECMMEVRSYNGSNHPEYLNDVSAFESIQFNGCFLFAFLIHN